jgi:Protein of unknown function (DUF3995)
MQTTLGIILILIFLFLAGVHFYWGLGGKWGLDAALPKTVNNENTMNPGIFGCFIVGFALLSVAVFVLIKVNFLEISIPYFILKYGQYFLATVFIIRAIGDFKYAGFSKKTQNTAFAINDTKYYSPLCLLIGIMFLLLNMHK